MWVLNPVACSSDWRSLVQLPRCILQKVLILREMNNNIGLCTSLGEAASDSAAASGIYVGHRVG